MQNGGRLKALKSVMELRILYPNLATLLSTYLNAYDAMTQDRAYRKALPADVAVDEILSNRGTQFDPNIADVIVES